MDEKITVNHGFDKKLCVTKSFSTKFDETSLTFQCFFFYRSIPNFFLHLTVLNINLVYSTTTKMPGRCLTQIKKKKEESR